MAKKAATKTSAKAKAAAPAKAKQTPKQTPKADRGPTIIGTMIETLRKASAKSPVTKAQIHAVLVKRFPDRDPDSMLGTVQSTVMPSEMVKRGVKLHKNDQGYWADK